MGAKVFSKAGMNGEYSQAVRPLTEQEPSGRTADQEEEAEEKQKHRVRKNMTNRVVKTKKEVVFYSGLRLFHQSAPIGALPPTGSIFLTAGTASEAARLAANRVAGAPLE